GLFHDEPSFIIKGHPVIFGPCLALAVALKFRLIYSVRGRGNTEHPAVFLMGAKTVDIHGHPPVGVTTTSTPECRPHTSHPRTWTAACDPRPGQWLPAAWPPAQKLMFASVSLRLLKPESSKAKVHQRHLTLLPQDSPSTRRCLRRPGKRGPAPSTVILVISA